MTTVQMRTYKKLWARQAYWKTPQKFRLRALRFAAKYPEKVKARLSAWKKKNLHRTSEYNSLYSKTNRAVERLRLREFHRKNPGLNATYCNRRRARALKSGGSFSHQEWIALCRKFGWRCASCGKRKKLTQDHIVPLSKGGTNSISNIQPLCKSCNSSKGVQ